eukprot:TRINITY_DN23501_c0_g2_i1.p1 TRINITY_DN23501_c0_g2~~TRINITY_DN23501_c0_g2_i1.p1  ORF type:complete len:599 (-),score=80.63 TRINITY_DN23501_c0_g2_i1:394-2190(-)
MSHYSDMASGEFSSPLKSFQRCRVGTTFKFTPSAASTASDVDPSEYSSGSLTPSIYTPRHPSSEVSTVEETPSPQATPRTNSKSRWALERALVAFNQDIKALAQEQSSEQKNVLLQRISQSSLSLTDALRRAKVGGADYIDELVAQAESVVGIAEELVTKAEAARIQNERGERAVRQSREAQMQRERARQQAEMQRAEARRASRVRLDSLVLEALNLNVNHSSLPVVKDVRDRLQSELAIAKSAGLAGDDVHPAELQRRRLHNAIRDALGQVRVCCRVRPLTNKEKAAGSEVAVNTVDGVSLEVSSSSSGPFEFSTVLGPEASQDDVFDECRDLVQSAVDGYNVTVFSYGQTGAGKTHTMFGTNQAPGVARRTIHEVFASLEQLPASVSAHVTTSVCEMYNNTVVDLLDSTGKSAVSVRSSADGSVDLDRLSEHTVSHPSELEALLARGMAQRAVGSHCLNSASSRSHLIFMIKLHRVDSQTAESFSGKLLLCDLAGSERLKRTEATGQQQREAIEINRSLTALADVLEAVARKRQQIPYRNHKLTQLLRDSVGGTAKTLMLLNCTPAAASVGETLASLAFAARAQQVTNAGSRLRSK